MSGSTDNGWVKLLGWTERFYGTVHKDMRRMVATELFALATCLLGAKVLKSGHKGWWSSFWRVNIGGLLGGLVGLGLAFAAWSAYDRIKAD